MWHLLEMHCRPRAATLDFILYGAMIVGTVLNRGTSGVFSYFHFLRGNALVCAKTVSEVYPSRSSASLVSRAAARRRSME